MAGIWKTREGAPKGWTALFSHLGSAYPANSVLNQTELRRWHLALGRVEHSNAPHNIDGHLVLR